MPLMPNTTSRCAENHLLSRCVKTFSTIDKCIFCKSQFLSAARMYVIVAAGMRLPNKQFQTYQCCTWISRKVRLIPACIQKTSEAPRLGKQRRNLSLSLSPPLLLSLSISPLSSGLNTYLLQIINYAAATTKIICTDGVAHYDSWCSDSVFDSL